MKRWVADVVTCTDAARGRGVISIVTAEPASVIDPAHRDAVAIDIDEALWEGAETGPRHQGRVTANYLTSMALGGAIAAVGLVSEPVPQSIAFVAASGIAPGFEPLAKIPLGLALRSWNVVRRGLVADGVGYAVRAAAAAAAFLALRAWGPPTVGALTVNPEVHAIEHPSAKTLLVSACAAAAGIVMVLAYRRSVIAGPLIVLVLIPAAALIGAAVAAGRFGLAYQGLERLVIDAALIVGLGTVLVLVKQATVHRRRPMVSRRRPARAVGGRLARPRDDAFFGARPRTHPTFRGGPP